MVQPNNMRRGKVAVFSAGVALITCLISLGAGELLLRMWQPPQLRFTGSHIMLPTNKTIENTYAFNSDKLRNHIIIRRNSLGFRGPEPPLHFSEHTTVIAVGGSTTECIFITEGKTWVDYVQKKMPKQIPDFWINNAGIDGHSTFGHIALMEQYVGALHPDYVLFLVGINDMAIGKGREQDMAVILGNDPGNTQSLTDFFRSHSLLAAYIDYMQRKKGGHELAAMNDTIISYNVLGSDTDYVPVTSSDLTIFAGYISAYKTRLRTLIDRTKGKGILPILMTQPAVYGFGTDKTSGVDLGDIIVSDFTEDGKKRKGSEKWMLLQLYNTATKDVARETDVPVIDLATEMPKDTSYFYDYIHFTEKGAEKVGEIVTGHLGSLLNTY